MSEAGLSWKTARPEYYKSGECAQEAWQEGLKERNSLDDEYTIITIDQTRQVLSTLIYVWFPDGERPSLPVTGKWDSIKLLGAVSDACETFFVPCEENFNSDTTIRLLDALQTEFGEKICVVLDNASDFTANAVQEFVEDTPIELCYLPRGSPALNPTEECLIELSGTDCLRILTSDKMLLSQHSTILSLHNSPRIYVHEYELRVILTDSLKYWLRSGRQS